MRLIKVDAQSISLEQLEVIVEAAIFTSDKPLSVNELKKQLAEKYVVSSQSIRNVLKQLQRHYQKRGIELVETASGFRFQAKQELSDDLGLLYQEKSVKYSRSILETMALIAYKQPITRGEIEEIRGVAVSSHIVKTLTERQWIKVIGHKEVPGRPAMYGTTREFLDYFSLKSIAELPELNSLEESTTVTSEITDII